MRYSTPTKKIHEDGGTSCMKRPTEGLHTHRKENWNTYFNDFDCAGRDAYCNI